MRLKILESTALLAGALVAFAGLPMRTQAAPADKDQRRAAKLLRDIRTEAWSANMHALRLAELSESPKPTWRAYDRLWNWIKPAVERMQMELSRLEDMRASLAPWEQTAIDNSKPLIQRISTETNDLRSLLNKRGANLTTLALKRDCDALSKDTDALTRAAAHHRTGS